MQAQNVSVSERVDHYMQFEHSCPQEDAKQEGSIPVNGQEYTFRTLLTGEYDENLPLMFIKHPVVVTTIRKPGIYSIIIHPLQE